MSRWINRIDHTAWLRQDIELSGRLVCILLALFVMGCTAAQEPIEGYYRSGHEVNIICIGEPENCYWLVDTDQEVRQQLKQLIAGKAQYAPVCVRLTALLSTVKADGFGGDYDGSISVQKLLGRCDTTGSTTQRASIRF